MNTKHLSIFRHFTIGLFLIGSLALAKERTMPAAAHSENELLPNKSNSFDLLEIGYITLNKPTMASSEEPGHPSSQAVDGNWGLNNYWSANPYAQWWQVDLEGVYRVRHINMLNYYDGTRYYQYDIESSLDGVNWSPLVDFNQNTEPATEIGDQFNVIRKARFLRVNMNFNSANVGVHIREFIAYGDFLYPITENVALNKPTTASGDEPGHPSSDAVDGDDSLSSWWGANPYAQWWQVDLEDIYALNAINIVNYYDGSRYYKYDIESSLDGVNWRLLADANFSSNEPTSPDGFTFSVNRNARYLRVNMNFNSANVGVHIVEFRAYGDLAPPPSSTENIALNKPTTASGNESGHTSADGVDGDDSLSSWWGANPYSQWWQVDLEGIYDLNSINLVNYYDGNRYYQYDIESSLDGINWTPLIDFNNNSEPATKAGNTFAFIRVARYLRVNMNFNSANAGVHIVEFRAFGTRSLVFIPDDNFEQALINLGYDDVLDNYVDISAIENVTQLDLSGRLGIADLTGIEDFKNLTHLNLFENLITELDVSQNTKLEYLNVFGGLSDNPGNYLTGLDLSKNTVLKHLVIGGYYDHSFTNIDLSKNTLLEILDLRYNWSFTEIDLSKNTNLKEVNAYFSTALRTMDLKNGNNSNLVSLNLNFAYDLECVQVDDVDFAINNENWLVDYTIVYSEDCSIERKTYVPDDDFEQALIDKGYDAILDDYVLTNNIKNIIELEIAYNYISTFEGIEDFVALEILIIGQNQLTNLDLSNNKRLKLLSFWSNNLTQIDLSENLELRFLDISSNPISNIDLSMNTSLEQLSANDTELVSLDLSKNNVLEFIKLRNNSSLETLNIKSGNNQVLQALDLTPSPNLKCVQVDDVDFAINNENWLIEDSSVYSLECSNIAASKSAINSVLYPNPATVSTTLKIDEIESMHQTIVFDITGNKVMEFSDSKNTEQTIDVSWLPKGIYLVRIHTGKAVETKKLVVQ